jgi:hypothetical protein
MKCHAIAFSIFGQSTTEECTSNLSVRDTIETEISPAQSLEFCKGKAEM